jgi:hypothetical protein
VAAAAHRVLRDAFPAQGAAFDAALAEDLAGVPDGLLEDAAVAFGKLVGTPSSRCAPATVERRRRLRGGHGPRRMEPDAAGLLPALAPHWDSVEPFALDRADRFRPAGPPDLAGAGYAAAFEDVKRLGSAASAERTAEQTETALFWADGAGTYTPPGHWNEIAADVAEQQGLGGADAARMLAALNVALADAGIAAWDAKYPTASGGPVTAVRLADAGRQRGHRGRPGVVAAAGHANHPDTCPATRPSAARRPRRSRTSSATPTLRRPAAPPCPASRATSTAPTRLRRRGRRSRAEPRFRRHPLRVLEPGRLGHGPRHRRLGAGRAR